MTEFVRLVEAEPDQKGSALASAAAHWRSGSEPDLMYEARPTSFRHVPGSPFAYWVSEAVRKLFTDLPPLEAEGRTGRAGLCTGEDFRFIRAWWEVDRHDLDQVWVPLAKGGAYSRYYADVHMVVKWQLAGRELFAFDGAYVRNPDFYFKPGLTWPLRTQAGLSLRAVGQGALPGQKGPIIYARNQEELLTLLGIANSRPFRSLVELQMAFGSYEVGVLQRTPVPDLASCLQLGFLARECWTLAQRQDRITQSSHSFAVPALLHTQADDLAAAGSSWAAELSRISAMQSGLQREIDDISFLAYGIEGADRQQMEDSFFKS